MQKMVKTIRLVVARRRLCLCCSAFTSSRFISCRSSAGAKYYAVGGNGDERRHHHRRGAREHSPTVTGVCSCPTRSRCNNLSINVTELFSQDDPNAVILELCGAVERFGDTYTDTAAHHEGPAPLSSPRWTRCRRACSTPGSGERHAARLQRRGDPRGDAYALQRRRREYNAETPGASSASGTRSTTASTSTPRPTFSPRTFRCRRSPISWSRTFPGFELSSSLCARIQNAVRRPPARLHRQADGGGMGDLRRQGTTRSTPTSARTA